MTEQVNQRVEQAWATPPRDEIPKLSRDHVAAMRASDDDAIWQMAGMQHVVLRTIGRRTGMPHDVALPTWLDPEGQRVVVASFAGATNHPSWFLNIQDREANPTVECQVQGGTFTCVPDILEGAERDRIWALLLADRAWYADYQAATARIIPLVRLPSPE